MEEGKEQRYRCKFCNKICASGKSLGGHMRVHLALISASKKEAELKIERAMDFEGSGDQNGGFQIQESSKSESSSKIIGGEKIKNCDAMELGVGDQSNGYELRDKPKKSWRFTDSKNVVSNKATSCRECGKKFLSFRALSGHMRCHSIKNREVHQCKKCGKEFDSMRALFGHMKCHSKKRGNESAESLSELDNFCPIRRRRSRIRYKIEPKPSFLDLNASNSALSEFDEFEEVAMCLIMLSKGVKERDMFNPVIESSDDDSAYYGAHSSGKGMRVSRNGGDFRSNRKLDIEISGKILSEGDEVKVKVEVSGDGPPCVDVIEEPEQFDEADSEILKSNSRKRSSLCVHTSVFEKYSTGNVADPDLEILNESEKNEGLECRICGMVFHSHQALRGHSASHKMQANNSSLDMNASLSFATEVDSKLGHTEREANQPHQEKAEKGSVYTKSSKRKERECPICFKIFSSGQALGGHKRAHLSGFTDSQTRDTSSAEITEDHEFPDLNFPAPIDEGIKGGDVGLRLWWAESVQEPEALVTN